MRSSCNESVSNRGRRVRRSLSVKVVIRTTVYLLTYLLTYLLKIIKEKERSLGAASLTRASRPGRTGARPARALPSVNTRIVLGSALTTMAGDLSSRAAGAHS